MADPLFSPMPMGPPQRFGAIPTLPNQAIRPPVAGMTQRGGDPVDNLTAFFQQNPGLLWTLAAGMMGGRQALPQALAGMPAAMKMDTERGRQSKQQAAWQAYLQSPEAKAMNPATRELLMAADPSAGVEAVAKSQFGGGGDEYGVTPMWGQDKEGNWFASQLSKRGGAKTITPPTGGKFAPPGDIAAAKSTGHKIGEGEGEAAVSLESMKSKLPGLKMVVDELGTLAEQATYTTAGKVTDEFRRQMGMEPRESAIARAKYNAMVSNQVLPLLRDTFGAQFTEREGATLRATLGDDNVSPAEKKAVLEAFINQKIRDIEATTAQAGGAARPAPAGGGWKIEEVR